MDRKIRQCCGMPLDETSFSTEPDGSVNEKYCKWCYSGGKFAYTDMNQMIDFLTDHMANETYSPEQVKEYLLTVIPGLEHWKKRRTPDKI